MGVIYKNLGFLGFPLYEVGNDGSVISLKWAKTNTKHLLTPSKQKNGYLYVYLTNKKRFYVHRLVALAFIPNPQCLPIINHKDEDKTNNYVENLEWCTASYNRTYGNAVEKQAKKLRGKKITEEHKAKISMSMKKHFCSYGERRKEDGRKYKCYNANLRLFKPIRLNISIILCNKAHCNR